MRRFAVAVCFALMALAATALAADITGKWTASMAGRGGGDPVTITYTFKQDGAKLTGSIDSPMGTMEIKDGKVEGDKLSFAMTFEGGPNGAMKMINEGTINGDEIKLTTKFEGADFPGAGDRPPMVLKRAK